MSRSTLLGSIGVELADGDAVGELAETVDHEAAAVDRPAGQHHAHAERGQPLHDVRADVFVAAADQGDPTMVGYGAQAPWDTARVGPGPTLGGHVVPPSTGIAGHRSGSEWCQWRKFLASGGL